MAKLHVILNFFSPTGKYVYTNIFVISETICKSESLLTGEECQLSLGRNVICIEVRRYWRKMSQICIGRKIFGHRRKVCNSWRRKRISTLISCMLIAHSPLSADHFHCLQQECEGRCVFHLFNSIFVRKPDEKKDLRICRCAGGVGVRDDRVGRGKKF